MIMPAGSSPRLRPSRNRGRVHTLRASRPTSYLVPTDASPPPPGRHSGAKRQKNRNNLGHMYDSAACNCPGPSRCTVMYSGGRGCLSYHLCCSYEPVPTVQSITTEAFEGRTPWPAYARLMAAHGRSSGRHAGHHHLRQPVSRCWQESSARQRMCVPFDRGPRTASLGA
jgi:hypothetical protein